MAIRWYRPRSGGTELELYVDPGLFTEVQDQADLAVFEEAQASSDPLREQLAAANGFLNLGEYDAWLEDRIWEIKDRLDFYSYQNRDETITVRDGDWFTPIAIESVCGEEVGNPATNMIDGDNGTWWQHVDNEAHDVVLQLRDYRKRVTKIRIRRDNNVRSQLQNLDVYAALNTGNLDNPNNLKATGVELLTPADWNEVVFDSPRNCRYIRLTGFGSAQAANEVRIREIEAWVITTTPE